MLNIKELTHPQLDKIKARFSINKGVLDVKPFDFKLNNMKASFSGKAGLNRKVDFRLNLDIPREKLGTQANSILENMVGKLEKFGLKEDLLPAIIKMTFRITGDMDKPKILPVIAGYEGESTGEIIQEIVEDKIEEVVEEKVDEARAELQSQADKILAQAQKQADAIMQQAQQAADKLRSEARKQGNNLIEKAGNPFEKIAAKATAKELNRQADKKADNLLQKAQKQANNLLQKARQKADNILQTEVKVFDKEK
jgi:vacuolar-type H+-ATPase subunit H